ncbi:hypothetical protein PCI56_00920 [Plesiomonas shigelloides subsp. oncorhynchi]|nr:hypothetical protein [Plesiomonas shigelloides]
MIRVFGQITDASGKGVPGAMIELRALKSTVEVLYGSVLPYKCDALGNYDFPLAIGAYDAYAQNDICGDMDYLGTAVVASNTTDGDLYHILVDGGINITPPMLESAMEYTRRAEQAAAAAETDRTQTGKDVATTTQNRQTSETKAREAAESAGEAKTARDSIVNDAADVRAKAKQVADNTVSVANNTAAVQRNTDQVAQNTQTVSVKAQQVSENTQSVAANTLSVTQMRDEVAAKTSMAQGAADTATQKAASAAGHDAAAAEYARQAQEAAQATAGALIDGGAVNLSGGVYPQPVMVGSIKRPTFWKVTKGGTVGGVDYGVGDTLIYTTSDSGSYYKIDNTESVTSVQGEKGAVTLTPEKIGADAAGTAAALVDQHAQKAGAHPISGISGLQSVLDSKYSQGNIVGSVSQSGGVPTGAIIQRGSNVNGEFVRFADGTQICTRYSVTNIQIGPNGRVNASTAVAAAFHGIDIIAHHKVNFFRGKTVAGALYFWFNFWQI